MELNKKNFNALGKWGLFILMHLGIVVSSGFFVTICVSMELPTEKKAEKKTFFLNLQACLDEGYDSLCLNSDLMRDVKRNDIELKNRMYTHEKIFEHTTKYPNLFSKEGGDLQVNFLSDLAGFHKNNFLLRVNDGETDNFSNEENYTHLERIWRDYRELSYLSSPIMTNDKKLDNFYETGSSDMFQSSCLHYLKQKNACLVIIKEIEFFSNKLLAQILTGTAIEGAKQCFESFKGFESLYSKFLVSCINEREDFIVLLSDISKYFVFGGKTAENYLHERNDILITGLQTADKVLFQRKIIQAFDEEKSVITSKNSDESFEISVKRIPSDSSLESDFHETCSGNIVEKKSSKFKRRFSSKTIEKSGSSDSSGKDKNKKEKK